MSNKTSYIIGTHPRCRESKAFQLRLGFRLSWSRSRVWSKGRENENFLFYTDNETNTHVRMEKERVTCFLRSLDLRLVN